MKARGFTLIEIVVVLFIMGVVIAMALALARAASGSAQAKMTTTALANGELALQNFVVQTRRLPCPADAALPATDISQGLELSGATAGSCANSQARGVLPWRSLGLAMQDVIDGYGNLLTYRVDPALTVPDAMNLTDCDAAGGTTIDATKASRCGACAVALLSACTAPAYALAGRGLKVQDQLVLAAGQKALMDPNSSPPMGAAYILVSHGATMASGYTSQGGLNPGLAPLGDREVQNAANAVLQPLYIDAPIDTSSTGTHFDDVLSRPSVFAVVNRANLGPRAHQ